MRAQARSRRASRPHARESPRLGSSPVLNESPLTMRFCGWSCPFYSKRAERRPGGPITRKTSADRADPTSCTSRANGCLRPQTPDLREKHRTHRTAHGTPQVGMSRGGGGDQLGSLPIRQFPARDHGFKTPRLRAAAPGSVTEMTGSGEDHGHTPLVGRADDLLIAH